jgi:hypothetical protein
MLQAAVRFFIHVAWTWMMRAGSLSLLKRGREIGEARKLAEMAQQPADAGRVALLRAAGDTPTNMKQPARRDETPTCKAN